MNRTMRNVLLIVLLIALVVGVRVCTLAMTPEPVEERVVFAPVPIMQVSSEYEDHTLMELPEIVPQEAIPMEDPTETEPETEPVEEHSYEKQLLAQLVQAEAGNQPLTGMRFVVDVVLNRVDDPRFPNTIEGVIYQDYQFSVIADGSFDRAASSVSDEARRAVDLEWEERLDYGVLYFSSTSSPVNGCRAFKYYDHWFSY